MRRRPPRRNGKSHPHDKNPDSRWARVFAKARHGSSHTTSYAPCPHIPLSPCRLLGTKVVLPTDELDSHLEHKIVLEQLEALLWAKKNLYTQTGSKKGKKNREDPLDAILKKEKKKSNNRFQCYEIGHFFEGKNDKKALEWYERAVKRGGELESALGLTRVVGATAQSQYMVGGTSVKNLQQHYGLCCEKNDNEGECFLKISQYFATLQSRSVEASKMMVTSLRAGALYGDRQSQREYALLMIQDLKQFDKAAYWTKLAARVGDLDCLRYLIGTLEEDKSQDHSREISELFKTLASLPEASAQDSVLYAQRLSAPKEAPPWFDKVLEKYTDTVKNQKIFFTQGQNFIAQGDVKQARRFFEKIHNSPGAPAEAPYYHQICAADDGRPVESTEFTDNPTAFGVVLELWIKRIIDLDTKSFLEPVKKLWTQDTTNEKVSFGYGVLLVCNKQYEEARPFFDTLEVPREWSLEHQSLFASCQYTIAIFQKDESLAKSAYTFDKDLEEKGEKDPRLAFYLYTLAELLKEGEEKAQNELQIRRLQRAMAGNVCAAFYEFGMCHMLEKHGYSENCDEAIKCFNQALERGCMQAQEALQKIAFYRDETNAWTE